MRAIAFTLAALLLSSSLIACQYQETDRAPTDDPDPTPTPETPFAGEPWVGRGRLSILLSGSDDAPDRDGVRTDAMIVASLDLETGQPILFSVPRNYGDIPLPHELAEVFGANMYTGMLKWLYGDAQAYPELAPDGGDPGMVALKQTISKLLGLEIDYYAMVDMTGFVELIDAIGGVEIDVQAPIIVRLLSASTDDEWQQFEIMPGLQRLDGQEALAYSRSRTGTTDYDRMERQRCLVSAVAEQMTLQTLLLTFPDLVDLIRDHIVTDIPLEMLPDLVMLREKIQTDQIVSIGFIPPEYHVGQSSEGHNLPAYEEILQTVRDALDDPGLFLNAEDLRSELDIRHC
jgi:polyisoprenyl-teichoic acid--peptidoglycan teichoic acid transferase